jgi:hypothetical protein
MPASSAHGGPTSVSAVASGGGRDGARPSSAKKTTIAVKIIDMLGEEVLITKNV